jgi:hypothetical protein
LRVDARHVEALGGLPVVVKLGGEAGRGTLVLDSWPALFSFFDLLLRSRVGRGDVRLHPERRALASRGRG